MALCALPFGFIIARAARDARFVGQTVEKQGQNQMRAARFRAKVALQVGAFVIACSSMCPLWPHPGQLPLTCPYAKRQSVKFQREGALPPHRQSEEMAAGWGSGITRVCLQGRIPVDQLAMFA